MKRNTTSEHKTSAVGTHLYISATLGFSGVSHSDACSRAKEYSCLASFHLRPEAERQRYGRGNNEKNWNAICARVSVLVCEDRATQLLPPVSYPLVLSGLTPRSRTPLGRTQQHGTERIASWSPHATDSVLPMLPIVLDGGCNR
jgi:hypothetical protein